MPLMVRSFLTARVAVLLALSALAVVGLARLRLDVEVLNLLPLNSPAPRGLLAYQQHFLNAGELVATLEAPESDEAAAAVAAVAKRMETRTDLIARLFWQPPWNDSIEGSARFLAWLWLNAPPEKVAELKGRLASQALASTLAGTREKMTTSLNPREFMLLPRDPYQLAAVSAESSETLQTPERFFSSEDGRFRMIYLYAAVPVQTYDECREWVREVRSEIGHALAEAGLAGDAKVRLTGRPVFVDEIASGMKSDLSTNAPGTLLMIGLLFYLVHREVRSLLLLVLTLLIVMVWTALIGAALLGQLNVISIGFASILLGLSEDFAIILHQEAKIHPQAGAQELRRLAGPGIFWSAITTAGAFALLNFSSLPGLRQLGTLVALGILLGAWVMIWLFLPVMLRVMKRTGPAPPERRLSGAAPMPVRRDRPARPERRLSGAAPWLATGLLAAGSITVLVVERPALSASPDVLRPRRSEASQTLAAVQANLGVNVEPYWILASGQTIPEVEEILGRIERSLEENAAAGRISSHELPRDLWPRERGQRANADVLREIAGRRALLNQAALDQGFTTEGLALTAAVLDEWETYKGAEPVWPRGRIADWLLPKFVSVTPTNYLALGLVYPTADFDAAKIIPPGDEERALVSGWRLLGQEVFGLVRREVPLIAAGVLAGVLGALYLTFRSWRTVAQSCAALALSGTTLLAAMSVLGWSWNLINLTALPLLLGMGIDYSIHIQLALRRLGHRRQEVFASVGRALLLAGATSIIGFALLGNSSNLGMASLGKVCALGLAILLLVSVFLLPAWGALGRASRRQAGSPG